MSEFLLSSVSVKELSPSAAFSSAKSTGEATQAAAGTLLSGTGSGTQTGGGFNNILSTVTNQTAVNQSTLKRSDQHTNDEILSALTNLVNELEQVAPDSEALAGLREFLDGQDMSTLGLQTNIDGANLPEFLSKLDAMISSVMNELDESSGVSLSEPLDDDALASLAAAFTQLSNVVHEAAKKSGESGAGSTSSLLGFSFSGAKGKEGQWQQYDPQQLSQAEAQKVVHSEMQKTQSPETQKTLQSDPRNLQNQNFEAEHLVSESDKNFKTQIQQLVPETFDDISELAEPVINARADLSDKPAPKFSDLQLRTLNDSLKQYSTTLSTPVQSQQWSEEVSQKVVWFTGRNIQAAEMHLNPAELGPIDVKINVQNDVASVTFNVHNASVRDLLESNVVRLREMMEASGVNVGDVNVDSGDREQSQHSGSDSEQQGFGQSGRSAGGDVELGLEEQVLKVEQTNLVDYFV